MLFRLLIIWYSLDSVPLVFTGIEWCWNVSPVLQQNDCGMCSCLHVPLWCSSWIMSWHCPVDHEHDCQASSSRIALSQLFPMLKLITSFLNRNQSCVSMIRLHARPNCSFIFLQFLVLWNQHTRILRFCKWDLVIALDAVLRLELDFQVQSEFAGL